MRAPHLVLMGFMAAGKSSVGRVVAERVGCPWVDLDQAVVDAMGLSIPEIFQRWGEARFREAEHEALMAVLAGSGKRVVALGGGAVLCAASRRRLAAVDVFGVWLTVSLETVAERLQETGGRPLLNGKGPAQWEALYRERLRLYAKSPHRLRVATDRRTPEAIADEILGAWAV